jgi:hypothetical protein
MTQYWTPIGSDVQELDDESVLLRLAHLYEVLDNNPKLTWFVLLNHMLTITRRSLLKAKDIPG